MIHLKRWSYDIMGGPSQILNAILPVLRIPISWRDKFIFPLMKSGGDIGMVSVHLWVSLSGSPTIIWISNHSIHFKFGVDIFLVSVQNWFTFGQCWPNFSPLVAKKMTENGPKWWFLTITWKIIHRIQFKLGVYTYCASVQNWLTFWPCWSNFGPSSGHKMTENGCFRSLFEKAFKQYNSNLVCTLIWRVFRIVLFFGHVGQILALQWPSNDWKWWFPTIIWKSIHAIQFKLVVYTYWVSVQNWFVFWPRRQNFGSLVAIKCLKIVVSNHYLKKYSRNPIQTWCVYLLGECSELICCLATLVKFWPSSGHKMTENGCFRPLFEKAFKQSNSNLVCTLIRRVFRIDVFLATLARFWPSSGHKSTENDGFWPLSGKVFTQFNSNLMCTLIG